MCHNTGCWVFAVVLKYDKKPKSYQKSTQWWPMKGGLEKWHYFWTRSMSLFTWADKYTRPLCNDSGLQNCLLKPLDHHLSLPIDKLSTYKFWSFLGLLLNFPFHILCQQLPRGRKKTTIIHPSKSLTFTLLVLIHYLGPLMCTTSSEEQCSDDVVQPVYMYIIRVISFWSACGFNKHSRWLAMPEARMDNHTALPSKQ